MQKTLFLKNAVLLTATSLILRLVGLFWRVWLAARLGGEGMGLYQLIFNVYTLAAVAAGAGLPTAVIRLCADRAKEPRKQADLVRKSGRIALVLSGASAAVVSLSSRVLANGFLHDARAVKSLVVLCAALPFMGLSGVYRGYLTAQRKAAPCAASGLIEQAVRLPACFLLLRTYDTADPGQACALLFACDGAAEAAACLYLRLCIGRLPRATRQTPYWREIWHIAAPLTAGRYLTASLRAGEAVLLTRLLARSLSNVDALSGLGSVRGMALPLLMFPGSLLTGVSGLLLPELAEAVNTKKPYVLRAAVAKSLAVTYDFGLVCGCVFFVGGLSIGQLLYHSADVGRLIARLAPLVPLFYLDSMATGLLHGLDRQRLTTATAVGDCLMRLLLVWWLVPRFGLDGYLSVMYVSNLLTAGLLLLALTRRAALSVSLWRPVLSPLLVCVFLALFARAAVRGAGPLPVCLAAGASAGTVAAYCWFGTDLRRWFWR